MGGGNLANNKKKGFAISGILYPLLILTLFLVVQMLYMLQTRKNVLDKARTELADSINASNKIYTNEELSNLIDDYKIELDKLKDSQSKTLLSVYPVGSIYISYSATNPSSLFGGTWVAYGTGRTLVGMDTSNANFNTIGKTGGSGSQSITLSAANLPSHTHSIPALSGNTSAAGSHFHSFEYTSSSSGSRYGIALGYGASGTTKDPYIQAVADHTHTVTTKASTSGSTGSGSAFSVNTQNPYITVYMWRRTA